MFRSIIQHLRFPFSLLLLPIFLFAISETNQTLLSESNVWLLCIILHLLVYPSSNAYNSLQDQDKGSIGLIKLPSRPPKQLSWICGTLDVLAISLSAVINMYVAFGVGLYVLFSRLYSNRSIRIKKYPIAGFLTVFIFQGCWIFILTQFAAGQFSLSKSLPQAICASCLIGSMYPLSQIYQHQQDNEDGVISLSSKLGYRGTFIFSGILFCIGTSLFIIVHLIEHHSFQIMIFLGCQLPVVGYFIYWFCLVWKNTEKANFKHTMHMNILSAVCMNICFLILLFFK